MWGFNLGGIGKCFITYDQLSHENKNLEVISACINLKNVDFDISPLLEIDAKIINIKNRGDISWLPQCHRLIQQIKPDLIFTHGFNGPVVVTALTFRYKLKIPFVCSYHGEYHAPSSSRKLLAPFFNKAMHYLYRSKASGIVCVCEFSRNFLISCGISAKKIRVIYNGLKLCPVPNKDFYLKSSLNISPDSLIIGTTSRLDPIKGLDFLLEAAADLIVSGENIDIILVGDGNISDELKIQAKRLMIDHRVHFIGFQTDISPWLSLYDIFALPSIAEYHSIGLLEAMRAQKAIVATDVGGNLESVSHEKEALIVPAGDSIALKSALLRLIKSQNLRSSLALSARQRFTDNFTVDETKKRLATWLLSYAN